MAVASSDAARATLRALLAGDDTSSWLRDPLLPDGITAADDATALPTPPPAGYLAEQTYAFDPALAALLDRTPAAAIDLGPHELARFRAHSVDLTMRGGATSGVVYPLAVCEVARHYRVRSVGGASAGAIAAAATAAAELGRARSAAGRPCPDPAPGHVRAGYAGLAGIVEWLTELDEPDGRQRYRLASLFAPARATRDWWATVAEILRGRYPSAAARAVQAFGALWALFGVLVVGGGLAVTAATLPAGGVGVRVLVALGEFLTLTAVVLGLALYALRGGPDRPPDRPVPQRTLLAFTSAAARASRSLTWALLLTGGVAGQVGLGLTVDSPWRSLLVAVPVTLAVVALLVTGTVIAVYRFLARIGEHRYGLLDGISGPGRPLVPWLDETLSELAGQPGRPLTFGDLWWGDSAPDARAATDSRRRSINLQLVTTDLTKRQAVLFPLDEGADLFLDPTDLGLAVGDELATALCAPEHAVRAVTEDADGTWHPITVYPLPPPAQLPVIVAVRMSLALPGLFQAVRLYRIRRPSRVRDDGGRTLRAGDEVLRWPTSEQTGDEPIAEPAWFTDGGVTSNFPVQLFDAVLPQWPTLGLNLDDHPDGYEHQDVWVPQDWQTSAPPSVRLGGSAKALLGAVINTARTWRDTAQTAMPSTRGRVAWVREHPGEGGINIYMGRDVVASLALRGALAGARLRRRFAGPSAEWERHRWLRLRVATRALDEQRSHVAGVVPAYAPLLDPDAARAAATGPLPGAPKPLYLPPDPGFHPDAVALLRRTGSDDAVTGARDDAPRPAPELNLTPPT